MAATSKGLFKIINIIITLLTVMILLNAIISFASYKKNPQKIPGIMGFKFLSVLSGSMRPALETGDMIVVKHKDPAGIDVGDVITYWSGNQTMVTHRVLNRVFDGDAVSFETKGDSNNAHDNKLVKPEQIVGSMVLRIPYGGYISRFLSSRAGLLLLVVVVTVILGFSELKALIKKFIIKEEV